MLLWSRRRGIIMGDDPPYLVVGTEVSAKYKGAFCEAKVRKVVRSVKCKVTFKLGLGTAIITDDQIRGTLRVGATCEAKHPEKKEFVEATINKIQDCSQYTVVFDDGDITTLRRTALCLKSGRHFAESETLDQLPLTHPEHFSNPVIGGRKGRRSRQAHDDSSEDEEVRKKSKQKEEKEEDIGKVVCVELGDKKKQKDNWFPGLVVAPTAQDTVRIRVRDEYLVRSFKDGRYFTVPKKEATQFTREIGAKVDNHTLKAAVEKALMYLDKDELPPHWDRDLLFGLDESSGNSDSEAGFDSDSSDDEPREEKDHFVAQLYKFMDDRGTPINKGPTIGSKDVDLYKLFKVVHKLGGYNRVTNHNQWKTVSHKIGFGSSGSSVTNLVKQSYKKFLHSFEDFYRKLGCTMVNHPRGHRSRHRGGRSLIRDCDRATPIHVKEKPATPVLVPSTQAPTFPVVSAVPAPATVASLMPSASGNTVCTLVTAATSADVAPKAEVTSQPFATTEKASSEKSPSNRKQGLAACSKESKLTTDNAPMPEQVTPALKPAVLGGPASDNVLGASLSGGSCSNASTKDAQNAESVTVKVEPEQLENSATETKTVMPKLELAVVPNSEKPEAVVNSKEDKHLGVVKVDVKDDISNSPEIPSKQAEEQDCKLQEREVKKESMLHEKELRKDDDLHEKELKKEEKLNVRETKKEEKSKEKEVRGRMCDAVGDLQVSEDSAEMADPTPRAGKMQASQEPVKLVPATGGKPKLRDGLVKVKGKVKKDGTKKLPVKVVTSEKVTLRKKFKKQPVKEGKIKSVQEKEKKVEEPKKKLEKKPEEEEKQTRSKSKEDARVLKKEGPLQERKPAEVKAPVRDTRTPIRETVERMERRPRETRTPVRDTRTPARDLVERKLLAAREAAEKKPTTRELIEKKLAIQDVSEKKLLAKDMEKKLLVKDVEKKALVKDVDKKPLVKDVEKKTLVKDLEKETLVKDVKKKKKKKKKTLVKDVEKKTMVKDVEKKVLAKNVDKKTLVKDVEKKTLVKDVEKTLVKDVEKKTLVKDVEKKTLVKDVEKKTLVKDVEKKPVVKDVEKKPVVKDVEKKPVVKDVEKKPMVKDVEKKPVVKDGDKKILAKDVEKKVPVKDVEKKVPVKDVEKKVPVKDVEKKVPVKDVEKKVPVKEVEKKVPVKDVEKKAPVKDVEKKAGLREGGEKKAVMRESERRPSVREFEKKPVPLELDKKSTVRPKKPEENSPPLLPKKRGRKRKDAVEETAVVEETLGLLPSHIRVGVGDKLKVYYGPTQESKVTYEAKVLEIEGASSETMYLVHYTGWNTRYDEWIKRGRIAENLSWTPARAKRLQSQGSNGKATKPTLGKRGRPSLSSRPQELGGTQPPRSTTPSSVTSCSSRTKSPATPTTPHLPSRRTLRNTSAESSVPSFEFRRRTRRSSGFTDISVASLTESEDEDEDIDDDIEEEEEEEEEDDEEVDRLMSDAECRTVSPSELISGGSKREIETGLPTRRRALRKDEDDETSKNDEPPSDEPEEKKRPRRSKKLSAEPSTSSLSLTGGLDEELREKKVMPDLKVETVGRDVGSRGVGLSEDEQQPTGRDFDLNQIRSELKGIERAVTLGPDDDDDEDVALVLPSGDKDSILPNLSPSKVPEEDIIKCDSSDSVSIIEIVENSSSKDDDNCDSSMEDVYEFKEPEPFEFEVRTKRELQEGRRSGRIFDDVVESKNDKLPFPRKRPRIKVDSSPVLEGEVKRRYRRTVGRKSEQVTEPRKEELEKGTKGEVVEDVPKLLTSPSYDEVFDKLCQVKKSCEGDKTSEADELGPLRLFGELPGGSQVDDCEEDSNDRLVISEAEETAVEVEGPLFSHSKLFPNLVSSEPPVVVLESESSQPPDQTLQELQKPSLDSEAILFGGVFKTSDEKQKEVLELHDSSEKATEDCIAKDNNNVVNLLLQPKMVEDYEEDPINAAIQRVFERSLTDEDSSQDIFGGKSSPDNFHLILNSKEAQCISKPTFEEEILCDSSDDEESRLIIATKENEDVECLAESQEETTSEDGPCEVHLVEDDESTQDAVEIVEHTGAISCETSFKEITVESERLKSEVDVKVKEESQDQKTSVLKAWLQDSALADSWVYSGGESPDLSIVKMEETVSTQEDVAEDEVTQLGHCEDVKPVLNILIETVLDETVPVKIEQEDTASLEQVFEESSCLEELKVPQQEEQLRSSDQGEVAEEAVQEEVAPVLEPEPGKAVAEDMDAGLCSLLCEETIPGSPPTLTAEHIPPQDDKILEMPFASVPGSNCTSSSAFTPVEFPAVGGRSMSSPGKRVSGEAAPVLDNTPPATPTNSLSTASGSPRDEPETLSPNLDHDSKFHQDTFTINLENRSDNKTGHFSEEDSVLNVDMSSSSDARPGKKSSVAEKDKESGEVVSKKRRHSRKRSECDSKRGRHSSSRSQMGGGGSDSDDNTSENSASGSTPPVNATDSSMVSHSPRPSKYNFYVELDPDMDGSQRIALLQQNLQDLRKAYMAVKAELACIDRRRKKLRRREREDKALKQEVSCS